MKQAAKDAENTAAIQMTNDQAPMSIAEMLTWSLEFGHWEFSSMFSLANPNLP
jgi:hypothetical protein